MKLRIALVDDNSMDRLLAAEALQEVCTECSLDVYPSGQAVLAHLRTATSLPDVLLLDLNMPGLTGFDVLKALKADRRLSLIPVVMLTTSTAEADIEQAYTLHASAYVEKAPTFSAFLEQLQALIRFWQMNRVVPA